MSKPESAQSKPESAKPEKVTSLSIVSNHYLTVLSLHEKAIEDQIKEKVVFDREKAATFGLINQCVDAGIKEQDQYATELNKALSLSSDKINQREAEVKKGEETLKNAELEFQQKNYHFTDVAIFLQNPELNAAKCIQSAFKNKEIINSISKVFVELINRELFRDLCTFLTSNQIKEESFSQYIQGFYSQISNKALYPVVQLESTDNEPKDISLDDTLFSYLVNQAPQLNDEYYSIVNEQCINAIKSYYNNNQVFSRFFQENQLKFNELIIQSLQDLVKTVKREICEIFPKYLLPKYFGTVDNNENPRAPLLIKTQQSINDSLKAKLLNLGSHSPSYLPIVVKKELDTIKKELNTENIKQLSALVELPLSDQIILQEYAQIFGISYNEILYNIFESDINDCLKNSIDTIVELISKKDYNKLESTGLSPLEINKWSQKLTPNEYERVMQKIDQTPDLKTHQIFIQASINKYWFDIESRLFANNSKKNSAGQLDISTNDSIQLHLNILSYLEGRLASKEVVYNLFETKIKPQLVEIYEEKEHNNVPDFINYLESYVVEYLENMFIKFQNSVNEIKFITESPINQGNKYIPISNAARTWFQEMNKEMTRLKLTLEEL